MAMPTATPSNSPIMFAQINRFMSRLFFSNASDL